MIAFGKDDSLQASLCELRPRQVANGMNSFGIGKN
jgi:hypothetical protein